MRKLKRIIALVSVLIMIVLLATMTGCDKIQQMLKLGKYEPITVEPISYESYQEGFNYLSKVEVDKESVPDSVRDRKLEDNPDYEVSYEHVKASSSYEEMCAMGVDNSILYPGALVNIKDGAFNSIRIERGPATFSANLETTNGYGDLSCNVEDPSSLSNVRNGIREIVNNNISSTTNMPANYSYTLTEISNEKEFLMNLGLGIQVKKFALQENFSYDKMDKQTNLCFVIKQVYYTIDMDEPRMQNSRDLFADSVNSETIESTLDGTIPAYVSSVSYGRIAFITIQSNYTKKEIMNKLDALWGKMSENPGSSSSKHFSLEFDSTLNILSSASDTTVNCYVYGGSTNGQYLTFGQNESALSSVFSSFNGIENDPSSALPISYTLRHLDGTIAKVQSCEDYTVKHVEYKPKKLMDWSFLDTLIESKALFNDEKITLDFSAMINYSNLEENNVNANRQIVIPSNVKELIIKGPNDGTGNSIVYKGLSFLVSYRNDPISITLDNISFLSESYEYDSNNKTNKPLGIIPNGSNGSCIDARECSELNLIIKGNVSMNSFTGASAIIANNLNLIGNGILSVKGGKGADATIEGENGDDGSTAIVVNRVTINLIGEASIIGGPGGDGFKGADGIDGITVDDNNSNSAKGQNGSTGGNGGNGGNGIKGTISFCSGDITIRGGNGGAGGNGGNGGKGTTNNTSTFDYHSYGIFGAEIQEISHYNKAYKGGDGGDGGIGGNGGAPIETNSTISINNGSITLVYGDSGNGGDGGKGGEGGKGRKYYGYTTGVSYLICYDPGEGGEGGNGGNGGKKGGYQLLGNQVSDYLFESDYITIQQGQAGTVGEGGKGGKGGIGGAGGSTHDTANDHSAEKAADGNPGEDGKPGDFSMNHA